MTAAELFSADAAVVLEGPGLHTGAPGRVTLRRRPGPVALKATSRSGGAVEVPLAELRVVGTVRAVTLEAPGAFHVQTVDHLFSALAGLGVHEGVCIEVEGPELPILDGCALAWVTALRQLGVRKGAPRLRVARAGVVEARASRYDFAPPEAGHHEGGVHVEVTVSFPRTDLVTASAWSGDDGDYEARFASARTFAFVEEIEGLLRQGLARHVPKESVVVLTPDGALAAGRPFRPDEPVRHKLLDLLGDLYVHGGPPAGVVRAFRPGHGATHEAVLEALARGILEPV